MRIDSRAVHIHFCYRFDFDLREMDLSLLFFFTVYCVSVDFFLLFQGYSSRNSMEIMI